MDAAGATTRAKAGHLRYFILLMLFILTSVNYADRATLSIAGPAAAKDLGLDAISMGYIFSAFGWAYVIGQLPGGWLLDRFGSKRVYVTSLFIWSFFTCLQGGVWVLGATAAVIALFALRFLVGLAEAPCFPANSRVVSAWFPTKERGTASAIFNSAQYFATVLFAPLMGWITHQFGWPWVFVVMGGLGIVLAFVWSRTLHNPKDHPRMGQAELDLIEEGGALVNMDQPKAKTADDDKGLQWSYVRQLLGNRMLLGVYLGQYGLNAVTYFFLTWFPVYLVQARGMSILKAGFVASIPAVCGFAGGVLGGVVSDRLLRRGHSLTFARKAPLVVGMLMSTTMVAANYISTEWLIVAVMALAYFGKGFGALGWAVVSDTSPKEAVGLAGGMFNFIGSISAITTPIFIGYIVQGTGSFNGALVFVGANALLTVLSYLVIVGDIKRMELVKTK
ncbi:MFS transporter [Telmatospirillum siberiense]|uniref:MFS transporter n=2 Tax=Telmatospirillum siberiense TaxID=382514 RepID=A0A2N3PMT9_9PROT|nr:MFS transporter [Telmatospirillum siberiense]PKU21719.1 MFS transporter [Telmatospirillum siberiense]